MRRHRNLTYDEELENLAAAIPRVNNITIGGNSSLLDDSVDQRRLQSQNRDFIIRNMNVGTAP